MPNRAPVIITVDGTPRTFDPKGVDANGMSVFRNAAEEVLRKQETFGISLDEPKPNGRKTTKMVMKLLVPTTSVDDSGNEVITDDIFKIEIVSDGKRTRAQRAALRKKGLALGASALVADVADNPEALW